MAIIYVDPSAAVNGTGTFASPRKTYPTALAYGDIVLLKEGTTYSGGWTLPAPTGTGSAANRVTIGTYDAVTGSQVVSFERAARIDASAAQDAIFCNGVSYVTAIGLFLRGGRDFPYAGFRALNASYVRVEKCTVQNLVTGVGGGSYGVRLDNATGSAASRTKWEVIGNRISSVGGNAGILCVWGANSGEFVTDITVSGNDVQGLTDIPGFTPNGIFVGPRASTIYTDRAGLTSKGVRIEGNTVRNAPSFAFATNAVSVGGTQANVFRGNKAYNTGSGARDMHCMWFGATSGMVVEDNFVDTSTALAGGATGSGVGIFIDRNANDLDGCFDMVVRRNRILRTGRGATQAEEVGGAGIFVLQSRNIAVHSNMVAECKNGIVVWGGNGASDKSQNVRVFNNIVTDCELSAYYVCKIADLVLVANNVAAGGLRGFYIENSGAGAITNYSESNNVAHQSGTPWAAGNEPTQATPTVTPRVPSAGNATTNPLLDPVTYRPLPGSPLIGAGVNVGPLLDKSGKRFARQPSIGAYEFVRSRSARV